jgi:hypothetical protein
MKDNRSKKKLQPTVYSLRSRRGFTLLFASLIGALMLAIGLSIFNLIFKELVLSSTISESQSAFVAADSAAECALFWDTQHLGYSNSVFGGEGQTIVPNGLIGYWNFDEGSGNIAFDSVLSNDGSLSGVVWISGKLNTGVEMDPTDLVSFGNDSVFDLEEYTYAFWVNAGAPVGTWRQILVKGTGPVNGGRSPGVWLRPSDMGIHFMHSTSDGSQVGINQSSPIPTNQWVHIAVTSTGDAGTMSVYINGNLDQAVTHSGDLIANTGNLRLLGAANSINKADELRVYDKVLTRSEIELLAEQTVPDGSGPVAQGSGLSCNGSDITDPVTGWDTANGWDVTPGSGSDAATVFDVLFDDLSCAEVTVAKTGATTTIDSRGYNSCNLGNPRRVERGIRITY